MKTMFFKKALAIMLVLIVLASAAAPMALALTTKNGYTLLESKDLKTVTVNKKKAFNFSIQNFSDAYDSLAKDLVSIVEAEDAEDAKDCRLLNLYQGGSDKENKYFKSDGLDGSMIVLESPQNTKTKGKVNKITLYLSSSMRGQDNLSEILACVLMMLTAYDESKAEKIVYKIDDVVKKGKISGSERKASFTYGNMRFSVSAPKNSSYDWLTIIITPK